MAIHPTAIVDPAADIADSAEIGPYCIVGPEVTIGARTRLMAHVFLEGPTWIGEDNLIWGADYPHPDCVWPESRRYLEKHLGGLPERVRRKITRDNVARLYNL